MKIILTIFLTSLAVVVLMFLLNAASFDGKSKNKSGGDLQKKLNDDKKSF